MKLRLRRSPGAFATLLLCLVSAPALIGCPSAPSLTSEMVAFEFAHGKGKGAMTYVASTSGADVIADVRAELSRPESERTRHPSGPIERDLGGSNSPWHWRFIPSQWKLTQLSTEVCDAHPVYIEQNLDQWLASVVTYCPWAAWVSRELAR